jgi:hypothetical protein
MRVAAIVVTLLVVSSPALASESCLSMAEARRQFPDVHIYWHGPDHCWDATAAQRHQIHRVQRRTPVREVQQKIDQPKTDLSETDLSQTDQSKTDQSKTDQSKTDQSKWRDAMSAMLPDDGPAQRLEASRDARQDGTNDAAAGAPWTDRWVDIEQSPVVARWVDIPQVAPPPIGEPKAGLLITPSGVVLVCIVFWLALGTIGVLFAGTIRQRRSNSR